MLRGAEIVKAGLCNGFCIDARIGLGQHQHQQFADSQGVVAGFQETVPQPLRGPAGRGA